VHNLGFPDWAQVGTTAHRAHFGSRGPARAKVTTAHVPQCNVSDAVQLLLLAGVGILSRRAVPCAIYQAEVWRRASAGQLAVSITDHAACYGANMILSTVIITPAFAAVASLATIEQAGGRLCRVGITYRGTLILPTATANALLAYVQGNAAGIPNTEAANMEAAFTAAIA
jgi:hypothetical protein